MQPVLDLLQKTLQFFASPVGAALIAVISLLIAYGGFYYSRRQERIAQLSFAEEASSHRSKFPFDQVKASDLKDEKILDRLLLSHANIPYVHRLPNDEYEKFREGLFKIMSQPNKSRLLIKGVTGIGKTREAVELIQALDQGLPEDEKLTILIPRPDFDIPQEIPENLRLANLLLFINDLHLKYYLGNENPLSDTDNSFHARLLRVTNYFDGLCKGYGTFRIIAVTRSEPDLWQRIQPNDPFWASFTILDLPPLHADCVPEALHAISKSFPSLTVNDDVSSIISERNDGTFGSVIVFLANEVAQHNEEVTKEIAAQGFSGTYRSYWDTRIYEPMIAPHPERAKFFEALDILARVHIPFYTSIVVDLASRLWKTSYPRFFRKYVIRKAISEMKAWITVGEEFIICPEAYFENRVLLEQDTEQYISALAGTIIHVISQHRKNRTFMNVAINLANTVEDGFNLRHLSIQIWRKLENTYTNEAIIHNSLSSAFYWSGYLEKALLENVRTLELDPSYREAYCHRGDILAQMGNYRASERFYKTAVMMYDPGDNGVEWVLYERANNLEVLGKSEQAKAHYLKVLEIDPTYYSARYALAQLYNKEDNHQEATYHFDIGVKTKPQFFTTLTNQARMYLAFGSFEEAVKLLTEVIETKTAVELFDYELFYLRGVALMGKKLAQKAKEDFLKSRHYAKIALRKSGRNLDARLGLLLSEIALKDKKSFARLSKLSSNMDSNALLNLLMESVKLLEKSTSDPFHASVVEYLERKLMIQAMPETPTERVPMLAKLLRRRSGLAKLLKLERTPLEFLASKANELKSSLETQEIILEQDGIRIVLSGDQIFKMIEIRGRLLAGLPECINDGIAKTQERAAKILLLLLSNSQSSQGDEEKMGQSIPFLSAIRGLKDLQSQALNIKNKLDEEIIEVQTNNYYAKFIGSQILIDLRIKEGIDDESIKRLIEVINLALKKSQEAAAKTMIGLS